MIHTKELKFLYDGIEFEAVVIYSDEKSIDEQMYKKLI